jgi:hypothetical protein
MTEHKDLDMFDNMSNEDMEQFRLDLVEWKEDANREICRESLRCNQCRCKERYKGVVETRQLEIELKVLQVVNLTRFATEASKQDQLACQSNLDIIQAHNTRLLAPCEHDVRMLELNEFHNNLLHIESALENGSSINDIRPRLQPLLDEINS